MNAFGTRSMTRLFMLAPLLLTSVVTQAETVSITVKVTVEAAPCVINNHQPITVEFGDVLTTNVNGSNYRMPVNYTLTCDSPMSNNMQLQIQGVGAGFDSALLQTDRNNLGIELHSVGGKLVINTPLNFTYPAKPELWAVPVKQPGSTLTAGEFNAAATMKIDYR